MSRVPTDELKATPIVSAKWCAIQAEQLGGQGDVLALELTLGNGTKVVVWSGAPARDLEGWTTIGDLAPAVMDWLAEKAGGPR